MMEMVKGSNNQRKAMMTLSSSPCNSSTTTTQILEDEDLSDLRRGPWTVEEDFKLINYIASHGEGRWNTLARCAGLKRTGKSCRLRWLNYLRPDVRRGNITLEEQLMILELHSRWGNRWSKIAQHLPGRTDNEIKNYWRTRVQKHAKQLKCDVNSKQFKDAMRYLWMPRLMERIQAAAAAASSTVTPTAAPAAAPTCVANANNHHHLANNNSPMVNMGHVIGSSYTPENSNTSDSFGTPISDLTTDYYNIPVNPPNNPPSVDHYFPDGHQVGYSGSITSPTGGYFGHELEFQTIDQNNNRSWVDCGDTSDSFWNADDIWFLQQQLNHNNSM